MFNFKKLEEERATLQAEMSDIIEAAKKEERAFNEEETARFNECEKQIKAIDATISAEKKAAELRATVENPEEDDEANEERADEEVLDAFIRGEELRAGEMSKSSNGNIIPESISDDIIKSVTELSNVVGDIAMINATGTYKQIVEKDKITAGWTDELAEVTESAGSYETVEIDHYKLGALAKISLELINEAAFDVVSEAVTQMKESFAEKLEDGIFNGTGAKQPTGLFTGGTKFDLASEAAITADEVVQIFYALKSAYRTNAVWRMNNKTLLAIRLLKDKNGQYLFHEAELTQDYDGYILGKPVKVSDKINDFEIIFGDVKKGYKGNMLPSMFIQQLNEKYISQGAKGIIGFLFFDGKPVNNEAYVTAKHTA